MHFSLQALLSSLNAALSAGIAIESHESALESLFELQAAPTRCQQILSGAINLNFSFDDKKASPQLPTEKN